MSVHEEIKKALKEIIGDQMNLPILGIVKSVEGETCTVAINSGLELEGIKLKSTINDEDDFFIKTPAVKSNVVMMSLDGSIDNAVIVICDKYEKIELKQKGLNILLDSEDGKVSIKNDTVSLLDVLSDLASLLKQLKVPTPNGLSNTPFPDTIAAIEKFEQDFKTLLK